jgi:hypothetical protein
MNLGRTVFSQITEHLPAYEFQKCVDRYRGDSHFRGFSCLDQLLARCSIPSSRIEGYVCPDLAAQAAATS